MSSNFDGLERELAEIDDEEGTRVPTTAARLLPMLVAAVALLSFGAIIYYAYNRGVTTGTEVAAPLITPDGPAKVRPADPGGLEVPHRDKLVYGALDKTADDSRVEQLLPPPEDPMRPPVGAAPSTTAATSEDLFPKRQVPIPSVTGPKAEPDLPAPALAAPTAPPPKVGAEPDPSDTASPAPNVASTAAGQPDTGVAAASEAGDQKPANGEPARQAESTPAPAPAKEPEATVAKATPAAAPSAAAAGTSWRVQIASVRSADAARTEWARQQRSNPALLGKLDLVVREVALPEKGTFFRVQGGPLKDKAAAQQLCTALKQKKVGCLIVRP